MMHSGSDLSSTKPSLTTEFAQQDLHALQAVTDTALSHLALDDLLAALLERITDILHVDNAAVLLLDSAGEMLSVQAVLGLEEPGLSRVHVPVGEGFAGRIAATREPLVVDDITTFPVANPLLRDQLRSLAGVPLVVGAQLLGVVHVGTVLPRHFTAYDMHLLQQVADRMALAIDRVRLYEAEQQARELAEAARTEAERYAAQLAAIFDAMADGVVVFDTKGQLVQENAAQQRLEGRGTGLDFRAMSLSERQALFATRDERGRPLGLDEGPLARALRGEVVSGVETMDLCSRTLDGREVELNVSAAPIRDKEGHLTGVVGVFRDQTERKQMEHQLVASEERYRGVVESQTELISRYLPDTTLTFVNEANCRSMGLSREQLLGTKFIDLLPESAREPVRARIRSLLAHPGEPGVSTMEHQTRMADGSLRWQQWVNRTILDDTGQVIELQGVGRDVTERKQMEHQLHESEARYRATFDSAAIGVAIVDLAGRPLEVNDYVCRMLGYTGDELCTMSLRDFTHPDDVAENQALRRRVLDGDIGSYQFEKRYLHKDGYVVWARVSSSLVCDQDGTPMYFVTHLEDITPRKQLEQERAEQAEQLEAVMEAVPEALTVYDTDGRIVLANTAYNTVLARLLPQTSPGETVRQRVLQLGGFYSRDGTLLKEDEWAQTRALRGEVLASSDAVEIMLHSPAGDPLSFSMTAAPLRDPEGHITGAVAMSRDITEYKRLERERAEAHARELAAEEIAQQLNAFLAVAAHDIRTPVTVISTQVQLALRRAQRLAAGHTTDEPPTQTADDVAQSLGIAWSGVKRLRRLVEHLFDVAQAQTGTLILRLTPCDLSALVRGHVAAQQETVPGRHIVLQVPAEVVPVQADADRLDQVLGNLLSNALKYSPPDQPVMVRLEVVENQAVVRVTDHGPGLPQEEQSRIWELFHRVAGIEVQSWSGEASGSLGLGLHICKQLMELHPGGSVGVESIVGEGSTFWFRLPLAA